MKYLAALLMLMFAVHMNWVKGLQYRKQIRVNFAPNFLYVIFTPSIKNLSKFECPASNRRPDITLESI